MEKICWGCEHIYFSHSSPGYSELTPGSEFSLECDKRHWTFDTDNDGREQLRKCLLTAETCPDWTPITMVQL